MSKDVIIEKFYKKMIDSNFEAYGILDAQNKIHTLGTDSKIIGRIFEMFTQQILEEIATEEKLILETPEAQTLYPDFIMMENKNSTNKIAIDVKSTYIENERSKIIFTLGSYGSYMRNNTKNIAYKYTDYTKHYVIGYVYQRNDLAQQSKTYDYVDREKIQPPYNHVKYFIQEKYKIAGEKPGSGNTENIGSFHTISIDDLKNGIGPFSKLGKEIYDIYWKYYPKYRSKNKPYSDIYTFIKWFKKQPENEIELLYNFNYDEVLNKINNYK